MTTSWRKICILILTRLRSVGSTDRVKIVAQIDRYPEKFDADGNWTEARRYLVTQDDDLSRLTSEPVMNLGEVNMGDPDTLMDFAAWAIETYPADKHVLIMSDHGAGWIGGWFDDDPTQGSMLVLDDISSALEEIRERTGIGKFELIGLDACNMGMLEVYSMLADHARFAVASEEYEPGVGWAYNHFLGELAGKPEINGADLGKAIVDGYIDRDMRILDDDSRKAMLASVGVKNEYSAEVIAEKLGEDLTISAVDLSALDPLHTSLNALLVHMKEMDQSLFAEARSHAQPFVNIFHDDLPSPLIDLGSFLDLVKEKSGDKKLSKLVDDVKIAIEKSTISERRGPNRPGASGISIYYPISQHYFTQTIYSQDNYPIQTSAFSEASLWDDFLAFHYGGKEYGQGPPDIAERIRPPGYEEISISSPIISPDVVSADDTEINVRVDIKGERIAYIYTMHMLQWEGRYLIYARDFLKGDANISSGGVVYPQWDKKDGVITLNYQDLIAPTIVSDGNKNVFAVVQPESYGRAVEDIIYSVYGYYIYSDTGERVDARMNFYADRGGEMRDILGFTGSLESGVRAYVIRPRKGDRFMFIDTWWEQDANGNWVDVLYEGNELTFGDEPFTQGLAINSVERGEYRIGILVEDLDGNEWASFAPVIVE